MGFLFNKRKHKQFNPAHSADNDLIAWLDANGGGFDLGGFDINNRPNSWRDHRPFPTGVQQTTPSQAPTLGGLTDGGNAFSWSEDLTQIWANSNMTVSLDGTQTPPFGSATKIIPTVTSGAHMMNQTSLLAGPVIYEILAKNNGSTSLIIDGIGTAPDVDKVAVYNLTSGATSGVSAGVTASTVDKGNGWWLCQFQVTRTKGEQVRLWVDSRSNYAGDGIKSIWIAAASSRIQSWANTYIKTGNPFIVPALFGKQILHFGGITVRMQSAANLWPLNYSQPMTAYLVMQQFGWGSSLGIFGTAITGDPTPDGCCLRQTAGGASPSIELFAGLAGPATSDLALNTWGLVTAVFNGAASTIQVNNGTITSGNAGTNNATGLDLFVCGTGASTGFCNGQIADMLLFSGAHDAARQETIKRYLSRKWGLITL